MVQHPNPQFKRKDVLLLDGEWDFQMNQDGVDRKINVPFSPESKLSGIEYKGFIKECRYKKVFNYTPKNEDERVIVCFGAVDYRALVYLNGKYIGSHVGGYTPFKFDITGSLKMGENLLLVVVYDMESGFYLSGKQSPKEQSFGCFYTRTTGIWQSVWLEFVPQKRISEVLFSPDINTPSVKVELVTNDCGKYKIEVFYQGELCGVAQGDVPYRTTATIPLSQKHLWELNEGRLYDVKITFEQDEVYSYFGLREVKYQGMKFYLNGKKTFQKLVLDQGYYPEGVYTPASIEEMQRDIDLGKRLGFNGARLHQKVFDPKFLYLCDKAGYMVWGEYASWGQDYSSLNQIGQFLNEWQETVMRDFNHPSIILWCPLNEVWLDWRTNIRQPDARFVEIVYNFTKTLDTTRPCIDTSGGRHTAKTDVYDYHCYEEEEKFKRYIERLEKEDVLKLSEFTFPDDNCAYKAGGPVHVSEFGGIAFVEKGATRNEVKVCNEAAVDSEDAWGYGKSEDDAEALIARFERLIDTMFACDKISGYCYTQLYDVEQERNGFFNYDRSNKLTEEQMDKIRDIQNRK